MSNFRRRAALVGRAVVEVLERRELLSAVSNADFEYPDVQGAFLESPSDASWSFSGASGIAASGSAVPDGTAQAYSGYQAGVLPGGSSISQSFYVDSSGDWAVSFQGLAVTGSGQVDVSIDGSSQGSFYPGGGYNLFATSTFYLSGGSHTISLGAYGGTILVDDVEVAASSSSTFQAPSLNATGPHQIDVSWDTGAASGPFTVQRSTDGSSFDDVASYASPTYNDSGLSASTTYYYRIYSSGDGRTSEVSSATTQSEQPWSAPSLSLAGAAVYLSWESVSWAYRVERSTDGGSSYSDVWINGTNYFYGQTSLYDDTASPQTTYYYRIVTAEGRASDPASITTPSGTLNLSSSVFSPVEVRLTWDWAPGQFQVERAINGSSFQYLTGVEATSHADTGVMPGTTYQYRVTASDGRVSNVSTIETPPVSLAAPTLTVNSPFQIGAQWPTLPYYAYYTLERSTNEWSFTPADPTNVNSVYNAIVDAAALPGTTYYYRVVSNTGAYPQIVSPVATIRTPGNAASIVNAPPVANDDKDFVVLHDRPLYVARSRGVLANDGDADHDPLQAVYGTLPTTGGGSVQLQQDGSFTYAAASHFTGEDKFTYQVTDGVATRSATVTIRVVNHAPTTMADRFRTHHGVAVSGNVALNDYDAEGDTMSYALVPGSAVGGTVALQAWGGFTFTPTPHTSGAASFSYVAADGVGPAEATTVTIDVWNSAPLLRDHVDSIHLGGEWSFDLAGLVNDPDGDIDPETDFGASADGPRFVVESMPAAATLSPGGALSFTPTQPGTTSYTFVVKVHDGASYSAPATVTLNVYNRVEGTPDLFVFHGGHEFSGDVSTNDYDVDEGDDLEYWLEGGELEDDLSTTLTGSWGSVNMSPQGQFMLTPAAYYQHDIVFEYAVHDGHAWSEPVTVTLKPVNPTPVAVEDIYYVMPEEQVTGTVLFNDVDDDKLRGDGKDEQRNGVSVVWVNATECKASSTFCLHEDGTFSFSAGKDFAGEATFSYRLRDGFSETSTPTTISFRGPGKFVGPNDKFLTISMNQSVPIDLLENVPAGTRLLSVQNAAVTGAPQQIPVAKGKIVPIGNQPGTVTFVPDENVVGDAYIPFDIGTADGIPTRSILMIRIAPPAAAAAADTIVVNLPEFDISTAMLTANDASLVPGQAASSMNVVVLENPRLGALTPLGGGVWRYVPVVKTGTDSFRYAVANSVGGASAPVTVTLNLAVPGALAIQADKAVTAENTPATIDVLANDRFDGAALPTAVSSTLTIVAQPAKGSAAVVDGKIVYTPEANWHGAWLEQSLNLPQWKLEPQIIRYRLTDNLGVTSEANLEVRVVPVNDAPVAVADTFTVDENNSAHANPAYDFYLLQNDTDADFAPSAPITARRVEIVSLPQHGRLSATAAENGLFRYAPFEDYEGTDTFTYRFFDDGWLESGTATVTITVAHVNEPPVAEDGRGGEDWSSTYADGKLTITGTAQLHATDPDGDNLTYSIVPDGLPEGLSFTISGSTVSVTRVVSLPTPPADAASWARFDFHYHATDSKNAHDDGLIQFGPIPGSPVSYQQGSWTIPAGGTNAQTGVTNGSAAGEISVSVSGDTFTISPTGSGGGNYAVSRTTGGEHINLNWNGSAASLNLDFPYARIGSAISVSGDLVVSARIVAAAMTSTGGDVFITAGANAAAGSEVITGAVSAGRDAKVDAAGVITGSITAGRDVIHVNANGTSGAILSSVQATGNIGQVSAGGSIGAGTSTTIQAGGNVGAVSAGARLRSSIDAGGSVISVYAQNIEASIAAGGSIGQVIAARGMSGSIDAGLDLAAVTIGELVGNIFPYVHADLAGSISVGRNITGAIRVSRDILGSIHAGQAILADVQAGRDITGGVTAGGSIAAISAGDILGGAVSAAAIPNGVRAARLEATVNVTGNLSSIFAMLDVTGGVTVGGTLGTSTAERDWKGAIQAGVMADLQVGRDVSGNVSSTGAIGDILAGRAIGGSISSSSGAISKVTAGHAWRLAFEEAGVIAGSITAYGNLGPITSLGGPLGAGGIDAAEIKSSQGSIAAITASGAINAAIFAYTNLSSVTAGMAATWMDPTDLHLSGGISGSIEATTGSIGSIVAEGTICAEITAGTTLQSLRGWAFYGTLSAAGNVGAIEAARGPIDAAIASTTGRVDMISAGGDVRGSIHAGTSVGPITIGLAGGGDLAASVTADGGDVGAIVVNGSRPVAWDAKLEVVFDPIAIARAASVEAWLAGGLTWTAPLKSQRIATGEHGHITGAIVAPAGKLLGVRAAGRIAGALSSGVAGGGPIWAGGDIAAPISLGPSSPTSQPTGGALRVTSWGQVLAPVTQATGLIVRALDGVTAPLSAAYGAVDLVSGGVVSGIVQAGLAANLASATDILADVNAQSVAQWAGGKIEGMVDAATEAMLFAYEIDIPHAKGIKGVVFGLGKAKGVFEVNDHLAMFSLGNITIGVGHRTREVTIVSKADVHASDLAANETLRVVAFGNVTGKYESTDQLRIAAFKVDDAEIKARDVFIDTIHNVDGKIETQGSGAVIRVLSGGFVNAAITSDDGVIDVMANKDVTGPIDGAFGANVTTYGSLLSNVHSSYGSVGVQAHGSVNGFITAFNSIDLHAWGDVNAELSTMNAAPDMPAAGGAIRAFVAGNLNAPVSAGANVDLDVWGAVNADVTAGVVGEAESDQVSLQITTQGGIADGVEIKSSGSVNISSLADVMASLIRGAGDAVDVEADGKLQGAAVEAAKDISLLAQSITGVSATSTGGGIDATSLAELEIVAVAAHDVSLTARNEVEAEVTVTAPRDPAPYAENATSVSVASIQSTVEAKIDAAWAAIAIYGRENVDVTINQSSAAASSVSIASGGNVTGTVNESGVAEMTGPTEGHAYRSAVSVAASGNVDMTITAPSALETAEASIDVTAGGSVTGTFASSGALSIDAGGEVSGTMTYGVEPDAYGRNDAPASIATPDTISGMTLTGHGSAEVVAMALLGSTLHINGSATVTVDAGFGSSDSVSAADGVSLTVIGGGVGGPVAAGGNVTILANGAIAGTVRGHDISITTTGSLDGKVFASGAVVASLDGKFTGQVDAGDDVSIVASQVVAGAVVTAVAKQVSTHPYAGATTPAGETTHPAYPYDAPGGDVSVTARDKVDMTATALGKGAQNARAGGAQFARTWATVTAVSPAA